jgi:uncharacterized protein (DUF1684 family)
MIRTVLLFLAVAALLTAGDYASEIAAWRKAREAALKAEGGWLSLAGLFWLHEGENRFGRDPSNDIVLPDGPPHAGFFRLHQGTVTVTMDGATRQIRHDSEDQVPVGRLRLQVILRGGRSGIRVRDPESEARRHFHGLEFFPASESWRITARFVSEPRRIPILNILGQTEENDCPGYAVFRIRGREYRLYPILEEPGAKELFYIFRDLTSGKETYGAGRFLYSGLPENGHVVLDFNQAYNPPCAFTPYATCPLPPKQNYLNVRIEAGEKKYH